MRHEVLESAETRKAKATYIENGDGSFSYECWNCEYPADYEGDRELVRFCPECGLRYDPQEPEEEWWAMGELKPCPFCGGEADEYEGDYGNGVYCMNCGAMVGEPIHLEFRVTERVTYEQAIEAWNTRYERTCKNLAEPDEMCDSPFCCSECGARGPYGEAIYAIGGCEKDDDGNVTFWDAWPMWRFCPNCGARVVSE